MPGPAGPAAARNGHVRITIVGAGAMGSLMAARLAAIAGKPGATPETSVEQVTLLGRPSDHLAAIQERGLRLVEQNGTSHTVPIHATSSPAEVEGSEIVLVLVKSWA